MSNPQSSPSEFCIGPNDQLEVILDAWQSATTRLQQTHEALRTEVSRLTHELEIKNRQLARKNRLADLGEIASHIAHEVRNNLVPVTLYMSLLRRRLSEDRGSLDLLTKIGAGFTALEAMVNDLLHFTADRDPRRVTLLVHSFLEEICGSLAPQFEAQGISVEIDVPPEEILVADRDMLRSALLNLVLNALDAMPDGGALLITSYCGHGWYELEVADSGPGLGTDALQKVFEPFFTTKSNGTGLGLAIVDRIAEVHGGEVLAQNCAEGGAAFTIKIPQPVTVAKGAAA